MAANPRTAIVTGASQGIGAGVLGAFLERGYQVVATAREITKSGAYSSTDNLDLVDGDIGDPATAAKARNPIRGVTAAVPMITKGGSIRSPSTWPWSTPRTASA